MNVVKRAGTPEITEAPTHTRQLARFALQSRWSDLPPHVQHEAVRSFVNWVGCAYGGAFHASVESALPALEALSGSNRCTVIGRATRLDPLNAVLLNGLSVGANAFDDAHVKTVIHPAAPTIAALLAHAEQHPVSGTAFLHALILSHEVQCRLSCGLAVAPANSHVGYYMTGLVGPVGVAAGVGKVMGLSEQQLVWAMGIGAMHGGGFRSSHGTMCSPFIPGIAGRSGLIAAQLAGSNFTCQDEPLTSPNGLLQVVGNPPNPNALIDGLGDHWECMNAAIKPFPNGCLIHASTDVCLDLTRSHNFASSDIETVALQVNELSLTLTGRREPKDAYEAQGSLYHWAAAALHHRRAGLYESSDACIHDPAVIALRERVFATAADDLQPDEARATVVLRDGRRLHAEVRPHVGSSQRPLSDEQLQTKFLDQVEPLWGPSKPVRIVVPFAVGGSTDLFARVLAQTLSQNTGQTFIVENKTGAGGSIGSAEVARSAPDGYTLLLSTVSTHAVAPLAKLPYNTVTDFTPIAHLADADLIILVAPNLGAKNMAELLELARKKPGSINYTSSGVGTISHLGFELLSVQTGIVINHIPYKGTGGAITDLSSGLVHMSMDVAPTGIPHMNAGRVRGLAVTGPHRSALLPDVQTVAETVPGFSVLTWFGLYGPRGMSPELTKRIHDEFAKVVQSPEMVQRMKGMGLEPGRGSSADFAAMVASDYARWGKVVKERNIKTE